jgi:hypothetical protein
MFWKYYFTWNLSSYCELLSSHTHTHTDTSGLGELFASSSSSIRYGDSPSISAAPTPSSSWSSSWLWLDGGSHGNQTVQATAWGLVIVTATLGGEIRTYQNFGLPRKIGRQAHLFWSMHDICYFCIVSENRIIILVLKLMLQAWSVPAEML